MFHAKTDFESKKQLVIDKIYDEIVCLKFILSAYNNSSIEPEYDEKGNFIFKDISFRLECLKSILNVIENYKEVV